MNSLGALRPWFKSLICIAELRRVPNLSSAVGLSIRPNPSSSSLYSTETQPQTLEKRPQARPQPFNTVLTIIIITIPTQIGTPYGWTCLGTRAVQNAQALISNIIAPNQDSNINHMRFGNGSSLVCPNHEIGLSSFDDSGRIDLAVDCRTVNDLQSP